MFVGGGLRAETLAGFIEKKTNQTLTRTKTRQSLNYEYTFSVFSEQYKIKIEPSNYVYNSKFSTNEHYQSDSKGFDGAVVTLYKNSTKLVEAEIRPTNKDYSFIASDDTTKRTKGEEDLFDTDTKEITPSLTILQAFKKALKALLEKEEITKTIKLLEDNQLKSFTNSTKPFVRDLNPDPINEL
jgi:hypothetical protein